MAAGGCWLHTATLGWVELDAGDVVLIPRGDVHALADKARGRTKPLDDFPLEEIGDRTYRMRAGGRGPQTLLACCSVTFEEPTVHPLLELMPAVLLVRAGGADDPVLPMLLDAMADEVRAQRIGAATLMTRLADVVLSRWRMHLASGWLRNDRLTVVETAAKLGYDSEASFSRAFKRFMGVPPSALRAPRPTRLPRSEG